MEDKNKGDKLKPTIIDKIKKHPMITEIMILGVIILVLTGIATYQILNNRIVIDTAEIYAPTISLAPSSPGILEKVYVSEGDEVSKHKIVALINGEALRTESDGVIISVKNIPGSIVSSANPIISMINTRDLRVIGHIDEDKGLSDIIVGQNVIFTVDAFGSKKYYGTVEEISPSARQQDIVFSISDKREVRQFDIKVKFDVDKYPELKNGMSARMKIYKS
jgi:multidrug resistance efflux pump